MDNFYFPVVLFFMCLISFIFGGIFLYKIMKKLDKDYYRKILESMNSEEMEMYLEVLKKVDRKLKQNSK